MWHIHGTRPVSHPETAADAKIQRDLLKSTATQAVPVSVYDRIIEHMVEGSAVLRAGATVIDTDTEVSSELIADGSPDLLGFLSRQAGEALAQAYGPHLITGTGSGQPTGAAISDDRPCRGFGGSAFAAIAATFGST
jgi:hypothetical protein